MVFLSNATPDGMISMKLMILKNIEWRNKKKTNTTIIIEVFVTWKLGRSQQMQQQERGKSQGKS